MSGGGGGLKAKVVNQVIHKPVQTYVGVGAFLYGLREYQTQKQYCYWFGKQDFERTVGKLEKK